MGIFHTNLSCWARLDLIKGCAVQYKTGVSFHSFISVHIAVGVWDVPALNTWHGLSFRMFQTCIETMSMTGGWLCESNRLLGVLSRLSLLGRGRDMEPPEPARFTIATICVRAVRFVRSAEVFRGDSGRVGFVALWVAEGRIVEFVAPVGDDEAKERACDDVGCVVSVVHGSGDGDEGGAHKWDSTQPCGDRVAASVEEVQLACEVQREVGETSERGGGVARGERSESIAKALAVDSDGTDGVCDETVGNSVLRSSQWLAPIDQVRARSSDSDLDESGDSHRESVGQDKPQQSIVKVPYTS